MITRETLDRLHGAPLPTVRHRVREILEQTPSFRALEAGERRDIANSMVNVMAYMVHPSGGDDRLAAAARRGDLARGLAEDPSKVKIQDTQQTAARDALQQRLANQPGQVGNEMSGSVVSQTGAVAGKLVKEVDFPKFVSSLIEGVFTSIVNSSIKQMQAFGNYLKAVAMTVKDFAAENVDPDEARQNLLSRNRNALELDNSGGKRRLKRRSGVDDDAMPDFKQLFGLMEDVDIDDEEGEAKIVESQQLQMARQRQQMLATMVLMGINRIVVTEGEIKATVTFDVSTHEGASRTATATMDDTQSHRDSAYEYKYKNDSDRDLWGTESSNSGSGSGANAVNTRISSATANNEDKSDAHMDAKAKMTGFVQVKFKSETFPLERLASATELQAVQERSNR